MSRSHRSKIFSIFISVFYFATQVALGSLVESNLWAERQKSKKTVQLASLPSPSPSHAKTVLNKLPSVSPVLHTAPKWSDFNKKGATLFSKNLRELVDSIPLTHGSIQDVYDSKNPVAPPVVLVQDVHLNNEAQFNITAILQELITSKQVGLVGVEGAFSPFDFSRFRSVDDKESIQSRTKELFVQNQIAAPAFVGITSPAAPPAFVGIDDPLHYEANVQAYLDSQEVKRKTLKGIETLRKDVDQAKERDFSDELKAFDQLKAAHHKGELGLGAYVKALAKHDSGLDFVIRQFIEAYEIEASLDFSKVDHERKAVLEKLAKQLTDKEMQDLLAQSLSYRLGRIGFGDYYAWLKRLCESKGISLKSASAFGDYIRYVLLSDGIKANELFKAIHEMEERVIAALAKSEEEKRVAREVERLYLIEKLVDFTLTAEEWEKYNTLSLRASNTYSSPLVGEGREGGLITTSIKTSNPHTRFLRNSRLSPSPYPRPQGAGKPSFNIFTVDLSPFERFYSEADIRSEKMVENLLMAVQSAKYKVRSSRNLDPFNTSHSELRTSHSSVLVVGGFHTPHIAKLLREQKTSYIIVSPKITKVDTASGSAYLSVFSREKTLLEKLFSGHKLFINPASVAAVGSTARFRHPGLPNVEAQMRKAADTERKIEPARSFLRRVQNGLKGAVHLSNIKPPAILNMFYEMGQSEKPKSLFGWTLYWLGEPRLIAPAWEIGPLCGIVYGLRLAGLSDFVGLWFISSLVFSFLHIDVYYQLYLNYKANYREDREKFWDSSVSYVIPLIIERWIFGLMLFPSLIWGLQSQNYMWIGLIVNFCIHLVVGNILREVIQFNVVPSTFLRPAEDRVLGTVLAFYSTSDPITTKAILTDFIRELNLTRLGSVQANAILNRLMQTSDKERVDKLVSKLINSWGLHNNSTLRFLITSANQKEKAQSFLSLFNLLNIEEQEGMQSGASKISRIFNWIVADNPMADIPLATQFVTRLHQHPHLKANAKEALFTICKTEIESIKLRLQYILDPTIMPRFLEAGEIFAKAGIVNAGAGYFLNLPEIVESDEATWSDFKQCLATIVQNTSDYNRSRVFDLLFSEDHLEMFFGGGDKKGDFLKTLAFYGSLLRQEKRLAYSILEGLIIGFKDEVVDIMLSQSEQDLILEFISKYRGFTPVLFQIYKEKGEQALEPLHQMGKKILSDDVGAQDVRDFIEGYDRQGFNGLGIFKAAVQMIIPPSGASFVGTHEVQELLKKYIEAGDLRAHIPPALRNRDFGDGEADAIPIVKWQLKPGETFDPEKKLGHLLEALRYKDQGLPDAEKEMRKKQDKENLVYALIAYFNDRSPPLQEAALEAFYAYASHNDQLGEKVDRIQPDDYQGLSLLEQLFTDKDNLSVLLNEVLEDIFRQDPRFVPQIAVEVGNPIDNPRALANRISGVAGSDRLNDAAKKERISNILQGFSTQDVVAQIIPLLADEALREMVRSLADTPKATRPATSYELTEELFQIPLQAIEKERVKFEQVETDQKVVLEFRVVKGIPYGLWGLNAGVCIATDVKLWKNPHFFLLGLFDRSTGKAVGFVHLFEVMQRREKLLTVPGIEPSVELFSDVKARDVYPLIEKALIKLAIAGDYDALDLPTDGNILSNRTDINKEAKKRYASRVKKLRAKVRWNNLPKPYLFNEVYEVWRRNIQRPAASLHGVWLNEFDNYETFEEYAKDAWRLENTRLYKRFGGWALLGAYLITMGEAGLIDTLVLAHALLWVWFFIEHVIDYLKYRRGSADGRAPPVSPWNMVYAAIIAALNIALPFGLQYLLLFNSVLAAVPQIVNLMVIAGSIAGSFVIHRAINEAAKLKGGVLGFVLIIALETVFLTLINQASLDWLPLCGLAVVFAAMHRKRSWKSNVSLMALFFVFTALPPVESTLFHFGYDVWVLWRMAKGIESEWTPLAAVVSWLGSVREAFLGRAIPALRDLLEERSRVSLLRRGRSALPPGALAFDLNSYQPVPLKSVYLEHARDGMIMRALPGEMILFRANGGESWMVESMKHIYCTAGHLLALGPSGDLWVGHVHLNEDGSPGEAGNAYRQLRLAIDLLKTQGFQKTFMVLGASKDFYGLPVQLGGNPQAALRRLQHKLEDEYKSKPNDPVPFSLHFGESVIRGPGLDSDTDTYLTSQGILHLQRDYPPRTERTGPVQPRVIPLFWADLARGHPDLVKALVSLEWDAERRLKARDWIVEGAQGKPAAGFGAQSSFGYLIGFALFSLAARLRGINVKDIRKPILYPLMAFLMAAGLFSVWAEYQGIKVLLTGEIDMVLAAVLLATALFIHFLLRRANPNINRGSPWILVLGSASDTLVLLNYLFFSSYLPHYLFIVGFIHGAVDLFWMVMDLWRLNQGRAKSTGNSLEDIQPTIQKGVAWLAQLGAALIKRDIFAIEGRKRFRLEEFGKPRFDDEAGLTAQLEKWIQHPSFKPMLMKALEHQLKGDSIRKEEIESLADVLIAVVLANGVRRETGAGETRANQNCLFLFKFDQSSKNEDQTYARKIQIMVAILRMGSIYPEILADASAYNDAVQAVEILERFGLVNRRDIQEIKSGNDAELAAEIERRNAAILVVPRSLKAFLAKTKSIVRIFEELSPALEAHALSRLRQAFRTILKAA